MAGNTSVLSNANAGCGFCVWWRHYETGRTHSRVGTCHRMPPTATLTLIEPDAERERHGRACWPRMDERDWCGEYTEKIES
jgi:hypothetical protein